jgi:prepilin-type N-terminal cleavage/methylation domain-containing protein
MTRRRAGFTFVEILTSMIIVAILAGIVIPKTGDFIKRAKAAAVVADIAAIRQNMEDFYNDSSRYPASGAMGQVPAGLAHYLPLNFSFVKPDYQLEYDNWTVTTSVSGVPAEVRLIGVTVQTGDARLGQLVMALLSLEPHFQAGDEYTFIVSGL